MHAIPPTPPFTINTPGPSVNHIAQSISPKSLSRNNLGLLAEDCQSQSSASRRLKARGSTARTRTINGRLQSGPRWPGRGSLHFETQRTTHSRLDCPIDTYRSRSSREGDEPEKITTCMHASSFWCNIDAEPCGNIKPNLAGTSRGRPPRVGIQANTGDLLVVDGVSFG